MSNGGASCVADVDRKVEEVAVCTVIVIGMFVFLIIDLGAITYVVDVSQGRS